MKKTLIALAVAGAFSGAAFAQSSVTLSGIVKGGVQSVKYSNGTSGNGSQFGMADGSSRFIISGSEDLGGGLRGIFQIDTRWRLEEGGGTLAGGNTFLGLAGAFGDVRIGRLDLHYGSGTDEHAARATALQASSITILSYINGTPIARGTRTDNVIQYNSPALGPVRLSAAYSTAYNINDGAPGNAKGDAINVQATLAMAPFRAGVSVWSAESEHASGGNPAVQEDAIRGWFGLTFGPFDFGVTYDQSKLEAPFGTETKRAAWSVPLKFTLPANAGTLLATYSSAGNRKVNGTTVNDSGARLISVGWDYGLSRRTSLGVSVADLKNKQNASYALFTGAALANLPNPTANQDARQIYVGLRHTF
jgi:predicted porin